MTMHWHFWPTVYWLIWFLAFVFWETIAGEKNLGGKDVPMLTQAVVRYVPWWVTIPFICWLFVHFTVRYFNPAYVRWLQNR